jgi:hypothetical protein
MKTTSIIILSFLSLINGFGQSLPPKQAYSLGVKQIHSGHSLTDPLFGQPWPGQYVELVANLNSLQGWSIFDVMVGKSTVPGSTMKARWDSPPGFGSPDARHQINNWELLSITERVPLAHQGGNSQQWYLDQIQEQKEYLSLFVNNAWNNGNNGNGTPTLLWTTWTNIDNSNGPWRQMLDTQGEEFERMQDYANANKPVSAPHVYIIPGHKMMARIYDDIQLNLVPGVTDINQFFSDNIHVNSLGAYAVAMIHYACIFNQSPVGLTNDLMQSPPAGFQKPSPALAAYLQNMVWEVITTYPRTGITGNATNIADNNMIKDVFVYPNPTSDFIYISNKEETMHSEKFIYNSMGHVVYFGTENIINLSQLSSGIYILRVGNQNVKIIKN